MLLVQFVYQVDYKKTNLLLCLSIEQSLPNSETSLNLINYLENSVGFIFSYAFLYLFYSHLLGNI